jgi:hypothetical protein
MSQVDSGTPFRLGPWTIMLVLCLLEADMTNNLRRVFGVELLLATGAGPHRNCLTVRIRQKARLNGSSTGSVQKSFSEVEAFTSVACGTAREPYSNRSGRLARPYSMGTESEGK